MDPWSEEEEVFSRASRMSDKQGCVSQTGMVLSGVVFADGLLNGESELLYLPWEQNGVNASCSVSGERERCPLECVLLSRWDPRVSKDSTEFEPLPTTSRYLGPRDSTVILESSPGCLSSFLSG